MAFGLAALAVPPLAVWLVSRARLVPVGRGARVASALVLLVVVAAVLVLAQRAESLRAIGRGSDQAACIEMPARALASGHWPYDRALIWSGNACSPGLGWIALAIPFVLARFYAGFLVLGAALLVALPERVMGARAVTAALVLVFSCLAAWQCMITGVDDLAIGIAFALLTALLAETRFTIAVGVAAGLVGTARFPFAFFPLALTAFLYLDGERDRAATFGGAALATLGLAHLAPLGIDPASYAADGPLHVLAKGAHLAAIGGRYAFAACGVAWIAYAVLAVPRLSGPNARHFHVATLTLLCVAAPAWADFAARSSSDALEVWQGGNWLLTALPCYAVALALSPRTGREGTLGRGASTA